MKIQPVLADLRTREAEAEIKRDVANAMIDVAKEVTAGKLEVAEKPNPAAAASTDPVEIARYRAARIFGQALTVLRLKARDEARVEARAELSAAFAEIKAADEAIVDIAGRLPKDLQSERARPERFQLYLIAVSWAGRFEQVFSMSGSFSAAGEIDFWTDVRAPAGTAHENAPQLIFTAIPDVAPIDRSRSSFDQPDVPEALAPVLFSRNSNAAAAINEGALKTFAVIDGGRLCNLPELLEATGLEYISLYGEDADPRMIRSGPWLVKLSEDSRFIRNFFLPDFERNKDTALWLKNWGIFLRSRADLDDVARHLRKFTRIRDEYDSWFYFRFWDADFMGLYLRQERAADFPLTQRLLDTVIVDGIVVTSPFDGCYTLHLEDVGAAERVRPAIGFRRDDFDAVADQLADCRAARVFDRNYHRLLRGEALTRLRDRISTARAACRDLGISDDDLPGTFILLGVVFARDFWKQEAFKDYWSSSRLAPAERFRLYLSGVKSSMRRAGLPLKAWW